MILRLLLPSVGLMMLALAAIIPADNARAERYALDTHRGAGDIAVELRYGVELRFDGHTQLRLARGDLTLAQLELQIAPVEGAGPPPALTGPLQSEIHHWGYYHVDGVAFWQTMADTPGRPVVAATDGQPWIWQERTVRPHVSVGRVASRPLQIATRRFATGDGPLYLGLLRLDDRRGAWLEGPEPALRWEGSTEWPLALLVARTEKELRFLAGQAHWTYAQVVGEGEGKWTAPPLCARCRKPQVERVTLNFEAAGDAVALHARFEGTPEPDLIAAEGFELLDQRLGEYLVAEVGAGASYRIPADTPWLRLALAAAESGVLEARVAMATGLWATPAKIEATLDRRLRDRSLAAADDPEIRPTSRRDLDLPDHLSPALLSSWPNPFREMTTIEVTVPATLEEAFELNDELRARVDPKMAAPYGSSPLVTVRVYNVSGKLIRLLDESPRDLGRFSVSWDGKDVQGRAVAAGAYYVNVTIGDWSVTKRVLRLKS